MPKKDEHDSVAEWLFGPLKALEDGKSFDEARAAAQAVRKRIEKEGAASAAASP